MTMPAQRPPSTTSTRWMRSVAICLAMSAAVASGATDWISSRGTMSSPTSESLCFKCHDQGSIYGNDSFAHREHVLEQGTPCIACHDPHGSAVFPHLINFMTSSNVSGTTLEITGAGMYSEPTWIDMGVNSGTCYLNCHGSLHDGKEY